MSHVRTKHLIRSLLFFSFFFSLVPLNLFIWCPPGTCRHSHSTYDVDRSQGNNLRMAPNNHPTINLLRRRPNSRTMAVRCSPSTLRSSFVQPNLPISSTYLTAGLHLDPSSYKAGPQNASGPPPPQTSYGGYNAPPTNQYGAPPNSNAYGSPAPHPGYGAPPPPPVSHNAYGAPAPPTGGYGGSAPPFPQGGQLMFLGTEVSPLEGMNMGMPLPAPMGTSKAMAFSVRETSGVLIESSTRISSLMGIFSDAFFSF